MVAVHVSSSGPLAYMHWPGVYVQAPASSHATSPVSASATQAAWSLIPQALAVLVVPVVVAQVLAVASKVQAASAVQSLVPSLSVSVARWATHASTQVQGALQALSLGILAQACCPVAMHVAAVPTEWQALAPLAA